MSEISLNVAPSPELISAAVPGPVRLRPDTAGAAAGPANAGAANPFATLLAGVLGGTQPMAAGTSPAPAGEVFPDLTPPAGPEPVVPLGLPAVAAPLPAGTAGESGGNGLPGTGNPLPVATDPAADQNPAARKAATPAPDGTDSTRIAPPSSRARVFLADLALTMPVDPGSGPMTDPATAPVDGARQAAAFTLSGRYLSGPGTPAGEAPARTPATGGFLAPAPAPGTTPEMLTPAVLPGNDAATLRLAGADPGRLPQLPGTGTEFLAGQLAAFAASSDTSTTAPTSPSGLTGTGATDAGSAALLGRLGSTGLPPLQPLGHSGAFAGGLADRLLTLGGPGAHSARLKLHPEHLGELDVEIRMDDGTAQVWFGTTTTQAREAIEGSLPRLRELFAEQGIQLTRTQVDAGGGQPGNPGHGPERRMSGGAWDDAPAWRPGRPDSVAQPAAGIRAGTGTRLLDVWA